MATELVSEEGSSDPLKELLPSTQEPMARRIIPPPARQRDARWIDLRVTIVPPSLFSQ